MRAPKTAPANVLTKPTRSSPEPKTTGATQTSKPIVLAPPSKPAGAIERAKPTDPSLRPQSVVGQGPRETHTTVADDTPIGGGPISDEAHIRAAAPDLLNLRIFAEVFDDIQKSRIATKNRIKSGVVDPVFLQPTLDRLEEAEKEADEALRGCYRSTVPQPIVDWQENNIAIGDHTLALLLGAIGHPVHTTVHEWQGTGSERVLVEVGTMDRSVSQLWSYCGHGDPARKRRKGMSAKEAASAGNPRAKMLVRLMAESCMKNRRSPYRHVYDEARMDYEQRDWPDLHRHNAALRKTGKAILKDLWIAGCQPAPTHPPNKRRSKKGAS